MTAGMPFHALKRRARAKRAWLRRIGGGGRSARAAGRRWTR